MICLVLNVPRAIASKQSHDRFPLVARDYPAYARDVGIQAPNPHISYGRAEHARKVLINRLCCCVAPRAGVGLPVLALGMFACWNAG